MNILVASPVRQKPSILREFLASLEALKTKSFQIQFCFIDDNESSESKRLLQEFKRKTASCDLVSLEGKVQTNYICDEHTHRWKEDTVWKVAAYKDWLLERARQLQVDALFLVDSDLVLHPKTIEQLLSNKVEIVSNIFWTVWQPGAPLLPQVWVSDHYTLFERGTQESLTEAEALRRQEAFLTKLQQPGLYEVGGLGACTLISKSALQKGMSFAQLHNVSFWGEDRHFCIRAVALGCKLHVDTHLPAYHIYRESDLSCVAEYRRCCSQPPRITLSMVVRNEGKRYLRRMLESSREYISDAVIIDDASTDETAALCQEVLKGIPLRLIRNKESLFSEEARLRRQQWEETLKVDPVWILALDADEVFEHRAASVLPALAADPTADSYFFRLYDFWNECSYRSDRCWSAHETYRPFMVRVRPGMRVQWNDMAQHCGRFPAIECHQPKRSNLRLKHYGWAREEERLAKYERYRRLDPEAKYGWKEQYDSILDPNPNLVCWTEGETP